MSCKINVYKTLLIIKTNPDVLIATVPGGTLFREIPVTFRRFF